MSATATEKTALVVQVKGEIIESNVSEYCSRIRATIAGINRDLKTDEDFGQAKQDVKALKTVEDSITNGKAKAIEQMEGINAILKELESTSDEAKEARLELNRLIKKREAEVKEEIRDAALGSLPFPAEPSDFKTIEEAMKGKRTVDTLRSAADEAADKIKATHDVARLLIDKAKEKHGPTIAFSEGQLLRMTKAELEVELERRIERQQADAERKRLEEQAAKAKAEAEKAKASSQHTERPDLTPPMPRKVEPIPVGNRGKTAQSEREELDNYIAIIRQALGPLKDARLALKHTNNIKRATAFAAALNPAWQELTKGFGK